MWPFRRRDRRQELDDEIRTHLEMAERDAIERGQSAADARARARREFGNVPHVKEAVRAATGWPRIDRLTRDLVHAVRSLRATPVVSAAALLSLTLGIGANTAIFSIMNSLALRELPVRDPSRLVVVTDGDASRPRAWSYPVWSQIAARSTLFAASAAWSPVRFNLAPAGQAEFIDGLWVSGSFFRTLGVPAIAGRTLSDADDRHGGGTNGPAAVISFGFWQRHFNGAADVVGQSISLDGVPFTIVGITPANFFGVEVGRTFDVAVPIETEPLVRGPDSVLGSSGTSFLTIIARLGPTQSIESATAALGRVRADIFQTTLGELTRVGARLVQWYLNTPLTLVPASTGVSALRRQYERPLVIVMVVSALVLLIACVNIANLLLARATARRHELSVRLALGASRGDLVRQVFIESVVLSGAGAAAGLIVAEWVGRALVHHLSTPDAAIVLDRSIDLRVLAFTVLVAMVTTVFFGTAPAIRASSVAPIDALKAQGRAAAAQTTGSGVLNWLVGLQVALSLVLVVAAGLFVRTFLSLTSRPLGFDPSRVLVVSVDMPRTITDASARVQFYEQARQAVRAVPGVADAGVAFVTPFDSRGFNPGVQMTGADAADSRLLRGNLITPGWFSALGTPILSGRDFTDQDRQGAPRVSIVNESFARMIAGDRNPIGRTFTMYPNMPIALGPIEIVGVVGDAIAQSLREPTRPLYYIPLAQFDYVNQLGVGSMALDVRTTTSVPMTLAKPITAALLAVSPQVALTFRPLTTTVETSLTQERLLAWLAVLFGAFALLLAGLGLYGVTWYAVSRRRAEIGIRMALGATPRAIVRLVLTRVAQLVGVGVVIGIGLSLWLAPPVGALLYGLAPRDPITLVGAAVFMAVVAVFAGWIPASRAARLDPTRVLHES
jgi:predicted permease